MRQLANFFIQRWQFSALMLTMIVAIGLNALSSVPKSEDPQVKFPGVAATITLPGLAPDEIERLVLIPLEQRFSALDDVVEVRSSAQFGTASLIVEFEWGVDPDRKFDNFLRELNRIRPELPSTVSEVLTFDADTADASVAIFALTSDERLVSRGLSKDAEAFSERLERVFGVQRVEIWGEVEPEVRISLDSDLLRSFGIPSRDVISVLSDAGAETAVGGVVSGSRNFQVISTSRYQNLSQIREIPIRSDAGRTVKIQDVATVAWANSSVRELSRFNGEPAIIIGVKGKLGTDTLALNERLRQAVADFEPRLSPSTLIHLGFEQSQAISHRLSKLSRDFAIAVLLILITLSPLGFRAALIVFASIPLSVSIGIFSLDLFGFSLNQLSISGLIISLGLLVDDSIVVTENIVKHLRMGKSASEAAMDGISGIGVPVLGCTLILILAFAPLIALPGEAGAFIRSLPVAVVSVVIASLFVAFTVTPFLVSRFYVTGYSGRSFLLETVMAGIHNVYRPILKMSLRAPKTTVILALFVFCAASTLVPKIGVAVFTENDSPYFLIDVRLQDGATVAETEAKMVEVDNLLAKRDDIVFRYANTGGSGPKVYYNVPEIIGESNAGQIFASFDTWEAIDWDSRLHEIRASMSNITSANIIVRRFQNGPTILAPIEVRIWGDDFSFLDEIADQVVNIIESVDGARDIYNTQASSLPGINLNVDREMSAALGVPLRDIDLTLQVALSGIEIGRFRDLNGETYPIRVRYQYGSEFPADKLNKLVVWGDDGLQTELGVISQPRIDPSPTSVTRQQSRRVVVVTANVEQGARTLDVSSKIYAALNSLSLPAGYRVTLGGQSEAATESFGGLAVVSLIAIISIFAVLTLQFRTFAQVLIVASVIPFGILGGLLGLYICGLPLSFTSMIGFLALIGIEIKNSILFVDLANDILSTSGDLNEAIEKSGEARFLPILLTSITAIGGLIPLAFDQSPLYSPLAVVMIGGLISSTLIARVVTPVVYYLLSPRTLKNALHS